MNTNQINMVADPGNAPGSSAGPGAVVLTSGGSPFTASATNPDPSATSTNPTFGPYNPGDASPGCWAQQVNYPSSFVNDMCSKLDKWAGNLGIWQAKITDKVTATELSLVQVNKEILIIQSTVETEISYKKVTEDELGKKQAELQVLATQSRESLANLPAQTQNALHNFSHWSSCRIWRYSEPTGATTK